MAVARSRRQRSLAKEKRETKTWILGPHLDHPRRQIIATSNEVTGRKRSRRTLARSSRSCASSTHQRNIAHAAAPHSPRSASRLRHSKCGQTHRHLVVHNSVQGLLTATLTLKVCLQISYDLACCTRRRATFGLSSLLVHWTLRTDIQPLPSLRPRRQANLA